MAKGHLIVIDEEPRGRKIEGIISGTPKPGTLMQVKASTEPVGGRHTWEVYNSSADGEQRLIAVLDIDWGQGKLATDAYVTGSRGWLYIPLPGDNLNMLVQNQSGTSDSFAIGDLLIADDGTGKLIATTGTPESESFIVMETVAALTADALCWCMFTGY